MKLRRAALLTLVLMTLLLAGAASAEFTVRMPDGITAFQENTILLNCPADGEVEWRVRDAFNRYASGRVAVTAGENRVSWDGTRADGQRIGVYNDIYVLEALFTGADGSMEEASCEVEVLRSRQTLLYALPSAETLFLGGGESWFVEAELVRAGTLVMDFYAADAPERLLGTKKQGIASAEPARVRWDGKVNGKALPAGDYLVRCYAAGNTDAVREVHVTLSASARVQPPIAPTGPVLPEDGMTEAEIWALMRKPSVVVDIISTNHQKVYQLPNKKSESLGTLHGQSQSLEVLEVADGWAKIRAWRHEDGAQVTGYVPAANLKWAWPNGEYGLLIDKRTQRMKVYRSGEVIAEVPVSTGLMGEDRLIRETAAGAFLTVERIEDFVDNGMRYMYPIRYDGGNLLHQIGCKMTRRHPDFSAQRADLGIKASHGCVRVPDEMTEGGVNAWWMWTNLPWHTRVMILDDPEARNARLAVLRGETVPDAQTQLLPVPGAVWEPEEAEAGVLTLTLGGDAVLGLRESYWKKDGTLADYLAANGSGWPFGGLQSLFSTDDMTFVNLECVLKADAAGERKDKPYRFRGLPEWAEALTAGSVEQVNIANNHYIDYQAKGKEATRAALDAAGVPYSGYSYTYIWEKDGRKIGFAGIRETIWKQDKKRVGREIAALREAGCDVVIYSCHWGQEYSPLHNDTQTQLARMAAEAGADLIVGTHPHVVQGVTVLGRTPVLWSLGNLMFGGTIDMSTFDAMCARVRLRFDDAGYAGCEITFVPVLTSSRAAEGVNDCHPVIAAGEDKARILRKVQDDTLFPISEKMWFPAR